MKKLNIGVLDLQGCVDPHRPHIEAAGANFIKVRTADDCTNIDAYILPGGESSAMLNLIRVFNLKETLLYEFRSKPVWGICAGSILMAKNILEHSQSSFGLLDISVLRNGYGRQNESFEAKVENYPVCFIRAPIIKNVSSNVEIMAKNGEHPCWVISGQYMATTFHPELSKEYPSPFHMYFIKKIACNST